MASYSLLPAFNLSTPVFPCKKTRSSKPLQVKAQSYRDHHHQHHHQGRSSRDVVETNLESLKVRIEEVRNKERLERCCLAEHGWNFAAHDSEQSLKSKKDEEMAEFVQLVGMMASTFGFTLFSCTFSLCIASLLLHSNLFQIIDCITHSFP